MPMTANRRLALPEDEITGQRPPPATLEPLVEAARAHAGAATSRDPNPAYAPDWRDSASPRPPGPRPLSPRGPRTRRLLSRRARFRRGGPKQQATDRRHDRAATLGACLDFAQRSLPFDCKDRHVATVLAGICRTHGRLPVQKEVLLPKHVVAMLDALPPVEPTEPPRVQAILLLGFAGGLCRWKIAGFVMSPEGSLKGSGRAEFFDDGVLLTSRSSTGWRKVESGRSSSERIWPVAALETWVKFARIARGPLFCAVVGREVGAEHLNDRHVAPLIKHLAIAAGVRVDLSEREPWEKLAGHSPRAGLASSAEIDERYVQKLLSHASSDMTCRCQWRRDRFRVNLAKGTGL